IVAIGASRDAAPSSGRAQWRTATPCPRASPPLAPLLEATYATRRRGTRPRRPRGLLPRPLPRPNEALHADARGFALARRFPRGRLRAIREDAHAYSAVAHGTLPAQQPRIFPIGQQGQTRTADVALPGSGPGAGEP